MGEVETRGFWLCAGTSRWAEFTRSSFSLHLGPYWKTWNSEFIYIAARACLYPA